jgi:hypothetical protein
MAFRLRMPLRSLLMAAMVGVLAGCGGDLAPGKAQNVADILLSPGGRVHVV